MHFDGSDILSCFPKAIEAVEIVQYMFYIKIIFSDSISSIFVVHV